ncbi:MAG: type II toxin-antitoxin system RelE/ParE family toxin [Patescibacteria group bacterium]
MYSYQFTPQFRKDFKKLPKLIQTKIINKLEYFLETRKPLSFAKQLKNFELGEYRFRIGDYRVIFDLEDEVLVVHKVGHRREIYR